jgi:hypothetical protein
MDVDAGFGSRLRCFAIHVIGGRATGCWALLWVADGWCETVGGRLHANAQMGGESESV